MNDHLRAHERYKSQECVIICNPPFDSKDLWNLLKILDFLKNIQLWRSRIRACPILPGIQSHVSPDTVICKFVYFDEKDRVIGVKRKLKNLKKPLNNFNKYINERLPKHEAQINSEAKKMGLITSTKNCAVSVLVKSSQKETSFKPVNYISDLNKVQNAVNVEKWLLYNLNVTIGAF